MNTDDGRFAAVSRILLALALLTSTHLSRAWAEPITGFYQIHVFERLVQTAGSDEFVSEPFEQQFPLSLTIDTASASDPRPGVRVFGSAMFSSVPLEPIPGAPDLPFQPGTAASFFIGIGRFLSATSVASAFDDLSFFRRAVELSVTIPPSESGTVPEVSDARMFLMLLGQDFGGPAFSYEGETEDTRVRFQGTATLLRIEPATPEPVPEPATVALVGSGLLLVLRRSRCRGGVQTETTRR